MSDIPAPHRERCCSNPTVEATFGLGDPDVAYVTVWCSNCGTDLVILDPPAVQPAPMPEAGE